MGVFLRRALMGFGGVFLALPQRSGGTKIVNWKAQGVWRIQCKLREAGASIVHLGLFLAYTV